jgi:hypothetical protein
VETQIAIVTFVPVKTVHAEPVTVTIAVAVVVVVVKKIKSYRFINHKRCAGTFCDLMDNIPGIEHR